MARNRRRARPNMGHFTITFEGCVTEKRFRGLATPEIYKSREDCLERLCQLFINYDEQDGYHGVPCPEHDRIVIWQWAAGSWTPVWAFVGHDLPDDGLRALGDELPRYGSLYRHAHKHF